MGNLLRSVLPAKFFGSIKVSWEETPLILLFLSIYLSPALISVSIGLMVLTLIIKVVREPNRYKLIATSGKAIRLFFTALGLYLFLILVDGFRSDIKVWSNEILMKLPLFIVPLYLIVNRINITRNPIPFLMFGVITSLFAFISVVNYWMNYSEINALLLQSKHIPILGGTHHIYFGLLLTLSFWIGVQFIYRNTTYQRMNQLWYWVCGISIFCLHILASRTGLIAFYISVFVGIIWVAVSMRTKWTRWLIAGFVILPLVAYLISGSLRNKVENSLEDFKAVTSGEDINYKSLAMRVEAWKTTFKVFQEHWMKGTGISELDSEIQKSYEARKTTLYKENRIGPHNQFLESGAAYGFTGMLTIIVLLFCGIGQLKSNPMMLVIIVLFLVAMCLESLLERQLGMIAFGLFYILALNPRESSQLTV